MRLAVASDVQKWFPDLRIAVGAIRGVKVGGTDSGLEDLVREETGEIARDL